MFSSEFIQDEFPGYTQIKDMLKEKFGKLMVRVSFLKEKANVGYGTLHLWGFEFPYKFEGISRDDYDATNPVTIIIAYDFKTKTFDADVRNFSLKITKQTQDFTTINDVKISNVHTGFSGPGFIPTKETLKAPNDNGYYDYQGCDELCWHLNSLMVRMGQIRIGGYSYFEVKADKLVPSSVVLF